MSSQQHRQDLGVSSMSTSSSKSIQHSAADHPLSSSSSSQLRLSSSIALMIKPHPENTYYNNQKKKETIPVLYYIQSSPSSNHDQSYPSLLRECFRYFQSLPPSPYFFRNANNTNTTTHLDGSPSSFHSTTMRSTTTTTTNSNITTITYDRNNSTTFPFSQHCSIFKIQLFPFCSILRDLSKLPYFNYNLYFHYDYSKFSIMRKIMSLSLIIGLGTFAKFFLNVLNHSKFYGKDLFRKTIEEHYERVQQQEMLAMSDDRTASGVDPFDPSPQQSHSMMDSSHHHHPKGGDSLSPTTVHSSHSPPPTVHSSHSQQQQQQPIRGLLTVVNHNSMLDEPILMSGLCPLSWFLRSDMIRYAVCASDMCFGHFLLGEFFKTVKVLPITRQGGLEQDAMKLIVHKLSNGGWINVFPEGRIYVDGEIHTCRRGIGKLIYDCDPTPHIYPIYHHGLSDVLPYDGIIPRIGKKITIMFEGDEIQVQDLVQKGRSGEMELDQVYLAIAKRVEEGMKQLKRRCEEEESKR